MKNESPPSVGFKLFPHTQFKSPVELCVEHEVLEIFLHTEDPNTVDRYIKEELAKKLAQKMIEEDLITIYTDHATDPETIKVRAKVKFIQE